MYFILFVFLYVLNFSVRKKVFFFKFSVRHFFVLNFKFFFVPKV